MDEKKKMMMMKKRSRDFDSRVEEEEEEDVINQKRSRLLVSEEVAGKSDYFEELHDDLVLCILRKLVSSANQPSDFLNAISTCRRFNQLGFHRLVLSKACPNTFAVDAKAWCVSSHRFLRRFVDAGNAEASYTLGMIRFYCLQNRGTGASLMAKAAINNHAAALYSLAVIQFNGSGGSKNDKDLRAGVALSARAAYLGHIDAIRELGHCLQDGYGVRQHVSEGRRFLVEANAREIATVLSTSSQYGYGSAASCPWARWYPKHRHIPGSPCPLLSDFGCTIPPPTPHLANKFLSDWFSSRGVPEEGLRLCSHAGCGRPETRRHEFRRCSVCGTVNYCSRACQALDWKFRHKMNCTPMLPEEQWAADGDEAEADDGDGDGDEEEEGAVEGDNGGPDGQS